MPNNHRKVLKNAFIMLIVASWIFSGWPRIWDRLSVPPKIQKAFAATCGTNGVPSGNTCTYTTSGADTFIVPSYATLTVTVWGGGGQGGGAGTASTNGGNGGQSVFNTTLIANGGNGGGKGITSKSGGAGGSGGSASGGDTNTTGNTGTGGLTSSVGGAGADAPNGGTGGGGGSAANGSPGNPPGAGAGGAGYSSGSARYSGGGGGSGGYTIKTYSAGQLSGTINLTVGNAGSGAGAGNKTGGVGAAGKVYVSWTTPNTAPSFTASTTDSPDPVTQGNSVTFAATASDSEGDSWYLAVCTTNAITPGAGGAAPTCTGGAYCVTASAVASGVQNSCNWTSSGSGAQNWYSFACDNNSNGSLCSSANSVNSPITVNAPTVSCSTDSSSVSFGALSTGAVSTASPNASSTMSCTYALGCTLSVSDANQGLSRTSPAYTINSGTATLAAGTEGYGIQGATTANGSGGTLTIAATYNKTGNDVGGLTTGGATLASSNAAVTGREVVVTHKAAISDTTPSGSYSDTVTYSCTGN